MNEELQPHYRGILESLQEDPQREGLKDTPKRAAEAVANNDVDAAVDYQRVVDALMPMSKANASRSWNAWPRNCSIRLWPLRPCAMPRSSAYWRCGLPSP